MKANTQLVIKVKLLRILTNIRFTKVVNGSTVRRKTIGM